MNTGRHIALLLLVAAAGSAAACNAGKSRYGSRYDPMRLVAKDRTLRAAAARVS